MRPEGRVPGIKSRRRQTSGVASGASLTSRGGILVGEIIKLTAGHCICDREDMSRLGGVGVCVAVLTRGCPQRGRRG